MIPRCPELVGPNDLVIVSDEGWVPFNRETAHELAVSGMLLAFSPEHVEILGGAETPSDRTLGHSAA